MSNTQRNYFTWQSNLETPLLTLKKILMDLFVMRRKCVFEAANVTLQKTKSPERASATQVEKSDS